MNRLGFQQPRIKCLALKAQKASRTARLLGQPALGFLNWPGTQSTQQISDLGRELLWWSHSQHWHLPSNQDWTIKRVRHRPTRPLLCSDTAHMESNDMKCFKLPSNLSVPVQTTPTASSWSTIPGKIHPMESIGMVTARGKACHQAVATRQRPVLRGQSFSSFVSKSCRVQKSGAGIWLQSRLARHRKLRSWVLETSETLRLEDPNTTAGGATKTKVCKIADQPNQIFYMSRFEITNQTVKQFQEHHTCHNPKWPDSAPHRSIELCHLLLESPQCNER